MKIRLDIKNYNMILIERLQKYQLYHQVKLISMNILLEKKSYLLQQVIKEAKFTYSSLGKAFEKQRKTIEEQGEKQIKSIQDKRSFKSIRKFTYHVSDSPIAEERFEKINNVDKKV